jgi:hypothetical protein
LRRAAFKERCLGFPLPDEYCSDIVPQIALTSRGLSRNVVEQVQTVYPQVHDAGVTSLSKAPGEIVMADKTQSEEQIETENIQGDMTGTMIGIETPIGVIMVTDEAQDGGLIPVQGHREGLARPLATNHEMITEVHDGAQERGLSRTTETRGAGWTELGFHEIPNDFNLYCIVMTYGYPILILKLSYVPCFYLSSCNTLEFMKDCDILDLLFFYKEAFSLFGTASVWGDKLKLTATWAEKL